MNDPSFLIRYNDIMTALSSPLYIVLPILERIWPRPAVHADIASVKSLFEGLINQAVYGPGKSAKGMLGLMVAHNDLTRDEIRDNLITFFMAGHDTTAGALCSLCYYFAIHPSIQARARTEVLAALGDRDPVEAADLKDTPYVLACIREALRLNTPIVSGVPRACAGDARLGNYAIPARTTLIVNVWAIHHSEREWEDPFAFRPERWLNADGKEVSKMPDQWSELDDASPNRVTLNGCFSRSAIYSRTKAMLWSQFCAIRTSSRDLHAFTGV
jgi:cytochrome P450